MRISIVACLLLLTPLAALAGNINRKADLTQQQRDAMAQITKIYQARQAKPDNVRASQRAVAKRAAAGIRPKVHGQRQVACPA